MDDTRQHQQLPGTSRLLFAIPEAADLLSISTAQMYRLIDAGQPETVHIGRAVRVPRGAVEAFVKRLRSVQQIPRALSPGQSRRPSYGGEPRW